MSDGRRQFVASDGRAHPADPLRRVPVLDTRARQVRDENRVLCDRPEVAVAATHGVCEDCLVQPQCRDLEKRRRFFDGLFRPARQPAGRDEWEGDDLGGHGRVLNRLLTV